MFQRRAFTPAEFLEGDSRKIIPGPFRHRFPNPHAPPVEIVPPRATSSPAQPVTPSPTPAADLGPPRPPDSHEVAPEPDQPSRFARAGDFTDPDQPERHPPTPDREQSRSLEPTAAACANSNALPSVSESRPVARPDGLPPDVEELLALLPPGSLREQLRTTWREWLRREEPGDTS